MSSLPRRSARLSPNLQSEQHQARSTHHTAPTFMNNFSQPSSASTSSHPSPISDTLHPPPPPPTPLQAQPHLQTQSHFMPHQQQQQQQQSHLYAPLPSPSATDMTSFLGRPHSQPNPYASQQMHLSYQNQLRQQQAFTEQQQLQVNQQNQQHHLHPHTNSMSEEHPARATNPGQLPPDFLAEAAKRAQMACLMRDFGDVSL